MKRLILMLLVVAVGGCTAAPDHIPLLCEAFSDAAYEVTKAEASKPAPDEEPAKCCSECKGTGKVRSGDGLSIVGCPCPDTCECKKHDAARTSR